ncbi:MAG TPA: hypothetical protein VGJ18_01380 [Gemmatimonadaceae bacterium]|jgi:hypothetical protein
MPQATAGAHPSGFKTPTGHEDTVFAIYKAYLDDLGRVGSRQDTVRQLYISLISALFVFLSATATTGALFSIQRSAQVLVGAIGGCLCVLWAIHMRSFGSLFHSKLGVLRRLEEQLPARPFTDETPQLASHHYIHVTNVDTGIAVVLTCLFAALVYYKVT